MEGRPFRVPFGLGMNAAKEVELAPFSPDHPATFWRFLCFLFQNQFIKNLTPLGCKLGSRPSQNTMIAARAAAEGNVLAHLS